MAARGPRYDEQQARDAIAASMSYTEALRRLGMCPSGSNSTTLRKYAERVWRIPTSHFDPVAARRLVPRSVDLATILVVGSPFSRARLKTRLYDAGLKERRCELCGQGEEWRGGRLGLVLDHVNGVRDDNRLENLRILCPNCNATLDTHCGRKNRRPVERRACGVCGLEFTPRSSRQRFCSRACGQRAPKPPPANKRVRPPLDQLVAEVEAEGWTATGRRHGVSATTIRTWVLGDGSPGGRPHGASGRLRPPADD